MSRTQTLVLDDFPHPEIARALSPNGRPHWTTKRHAASRVAARVLMRAAAYGLRPMHGPVILRATFTYPLRRKRDDDNLATGVMKAVRDALVKRRYLLNDDLQHLRQMPVEVVVEKGVRRLVLEFEEEE